MTPKQFLYIGGAILLGLGIFGFLVPEPVDDQSVLHFDVWENWGHTILGIVAIGAAFLVGSRARWLLTLLVGITAIGFAIAGFVVSGEAFPNLGGANLENPVDNVLHLVVGVWALGVAAYSYRSMMGRREMTMEEGGEEEEKPRMRRAA